MIEEQTHFCNSSHNSGKYYRLPTKMKYTHILAYFIKKKCSAKKSFSYPIVSKMLNGRAQNVRYFLSLLHF